MAKTYAQLQQELNDLMAWFEGDNLDVDQAIKKYQRGMEVVAELENLLKTAENKVKKVKASFADSNS